MSYHLNKLFKLLFLPVVAFLLVSCLEKANNTPVSSISLITSAEFSGATAAINKVSSVLIIWNLSTNTGITAYRIYRYNNLGQLEQIGTVDSSVKQFVDGNVLSGQMYSYVVRAVDSKGIEETNTKIVSSLVYAGIQSVSAEGVDRVRVSLAPSIGSLSKVRIYGQASRGGQKTLLGEVSPNSSSFLVTGLKSGVNYKFNVQGYVETLDIEDQNDVFKDATTNSISYGDSSGQGSRYMGFINIKAYGPSPGSALEPKALKVILNWLAMSDLPSGSSYFIVRTKKGSQLDLFTESPCTATTDTSCRVCGPIANTGGATLTCADDNVASYPAVYDYGIAVQIQNAAGETWIEELPSQDAKFKVQIPIPPANMVLAHRDAVNYEACYLMNRTPDPLNHQRCPYTGRGAVPLTSGSSLNPSSLLNLDTSFYDFGYHLFVDRFEVACNWTKGASGGKCFDANSNGDCYGNDDPENYPSAADRFSFRGQVGDVYLKITNSTSNFNTCYIRTSSGWKSATALNSSGDFSLIATNDPILGHRPPLVNVSQANAYSICNASNVPGLGQKRLPRMREFRAYAAWAVLPFEVDSSLPSQARGYENSAILSLGQCSTNSATAGNSTFVDQNIRTDFTDPENWFTRVDLTPGVAGDGYTNLNSSKTLFIGNPITNKCLSRFGVQDAIGNVEEWVSDNTGNCSSSGAPYTDAKCLGLSSSLDVGNRDIEGIPFDGNTAPRWNSWNGTTGDGWLPMFTSPSSPYLNIPLGIPFKAPEENLLVSAMKNRTFNGDSWGDWQDKFIIIDSSNATNLNSYLTTPVRSVRMGGGSNSGYSSGRWYTNAATSVYNSSRDIGFRCVIPAE